MRTRIPSNKSASVLADKKRELPNLPKAKSQYRRAGARGKAWARLLSGGRRLRPAANFKCPPGSPDGQQPSKLAAYPVLPVF